MTEDEMQPIVENSDSEGFTCSRLCSDYGHIVNKGVTRKKPLSDDMESLLKTTLNRCLRTTDLVAYGLASMLGGSIYVLTGAIMNGHTGPAVFVAYLVAGIVALFNVLVYSELACRIPKAGSCYSYSYVILGELLAFLTGWSILLEYVLSISSVARGWSNMLDGLLEGRIKEWVIAHVGRMAPPGAFLAEYPDLIGVTLIIITASISCCGVRSSARVTGVFILIYFLTLIVVSIYMLVYNNPANINLPVPPSLSGIDHMSVNERFLPYGIGGLISGVAICFNAFIGFDAISTCAEETQSPGKSIPRANVLAVFLVTLITVVASLSLVLYYPWYLISNDSPFLSAISGNLGAGSATARQVLFYFVGVGCLIGLSSSLLSYLVAGPRICFSIADDGLLPSFCANICKPFQTPVVSTVFITVLTAVLDLLFSVESLADFLSLGTLVAYSIASVSLLVLRYCPQPERREQLPAVDDKAVEASEIAPVEPTDELVRVGRPGYLKSSYSSILSDWCITLFNKGSPGSMLRVLIPIYLLLNITLILVLRLGAPQSLWPMWRIVTMPILLVLMAFCILFASAYEQFPSPHLDLYRLPLVPLFPFATISINMFLISQLSWITWARFGVWLFIGFVFYFAYGVCHSKAIEGPLYSSKKPKAKDDHL